MLSKQSTTCQVGSNRAVPPEQEVAIVSTEIIVDRYGIGKSDVGPNDFLLVGVDRWGQKAQFHVAYHCAEPRGFLTLEFEGSPIGLVRPVQTEGSIEGEVDVWHEGNYLLALRQDGSVVFQRNVMISTEQFRKNLHGAGNSLPGLLVQQVVELGERVNEGTLIRAVAMPWFELVNMFKNDPEFIYKLSPEKWEEMVAGAYARQGASEVILTPRSGDLGRDVIAVFPDFGTIRVLDQVKRYSPGQVVTANDVRALTGVLYKDLGATKGFVTTTSEFAPGIAAEFKDLMPGRLTLRAKSDLLAWLESLL